MDGWNVCVAGVVRLKITFPVIHHILYFCIFMDLRDIHGVDMACNQQQLLLYIARYTIILYILYTTTDDGDDDDHISLDVQHERTNYR